MIVQIVLSFVQVLLVAGLVYHYLLLIASWPTPRRNSRPATPTKTFAIVIPAHNEEQVIGGTVTQLMNVDYPRDLYDVWVVADYCSDGTAQAAREAGAICCERNEGPRGRKAYPLQWLLQTILNGRRAYDAIVIFDADSYVDQNFLKEMDAELLHGYSALQGCHVISNPNDSPLSRLAAIDMRLNNLLRNRAKLNLRLSSRLMGDAMCLSMTLLRNHQWKSESLAEDREFEMYLLLQGIRVRYVPGAVSYGEATPRWKDASKQRVRWYGGVVQLRRRFFKPLLMHGLKTGDLASLDRALELFLPSFSTLSVATLGTAIIQLIWPDLESLLPVGLTALATLAWIVFPFAGLGVDRAPAWTYRTMIYAPGYIVWRIIQEAHAILKRGQVEWVRTRRREEQPKHV